MATYTIHKSNIDVVGYIWQPTSDPRAMTYNLDAFDVKNIQNEEGTITRDDVEDYICTHTGDFSQIMDFRASIWDGEKDVDFGFANEDSEFAFLDAMYPSEEE